MDEVRQSDWSEVGEAAATATLEAFKARAPDIVRRTVDDLYGDILYAAQEYFVENVDFNIKSRIDAADRQALSDRLRVVKADALVADLLKTLQRIAAATPRSTNSCTASDMASWTQAVAAEAIEQASPSLYYEGCMR